MPLKRSLRANQWPPADARSHKFRVAHRGAAPASSDAHSDQLASIMANQYFYVRARRPRPNSAPERCPRDNTWTRRHGGHGGAHGWRVRGRALSATTRKRRERPALRHRSNVAAHAHTRSPVPHTETRECAQARERALGHRQREGRAASLARRPHGEEVADLGQGPRVDHAEIY